MTIIKVKKDRNFFTALNLPFNDERLSWEASGVMGYLLSKPDDWQCNNKDIENRRKSAGSDKVKRIFRELRQCGYIERHRVRAEKGKFKWVTNVYESPESNPSIINLLHIIAILAKFLNASIVLKPTSGQPINGLDHHIVSTKQPSTKQLKNQNTSKTKKVLQADTTLTEQPLTEKPHLNHNFRATDQYNLNWKQCKWCSMQTEFGAFWFNPKHIIRKGLNTQYCSGAMSQPFKGSPVEPLTESGSSQPTAEKPPTLLDYLIDCSYQQLKTLVIKFVNYLQQSEGWYIEIVINTKDKLGGKLMRVTFAENGRSVYFPYAIFSDEDILRERLRSVMETVAQTEGLDIEGEYGEEFYNNLNKAKTVCKHWFDMSIIDNCRLCKTEQPPTDSPNTNIVYQMPCRVCESTLTLTKIIKGGYEGECYNCKEDYAYELLPKSAIKIASPDSKLIPTPPQSSLELSTSFNLKELPEHNFVESGDHYQCGFCDIVKSDGYAPSCWIEINGKLEFFCHETDLPTCGQCLEMVARCVAIIAGLVHKFGSATTPVTKTIAAEAVTRTKPVQPPNNTYPVTEAKKRILTDSLGNCDLKGPYTPETLKPLIADNKIKKIDPASFPRFTSVQAAKYLVSEGLGFDGYIINNGADFRRGDSGSPVNCPRRFETEWSVTSFLVSAEQFFAEIEANKRGLSIGEVLTAGLVPNKQEIAQEIAGLSNKCSHSAAKKGKCFYCFEKIYTLSSATESKLESAPVASPPKIIILEELKRKDTTLITPLRLTTTPQDDGFDFAGGGGSGEGKYNPLKRVALKADEVLAMACGVAPTGLSKRYSSEVTQAYRDLERNVNGFKKARTLFGGSEAQIIIGYTIAAYALVFNRYPVTASEWGANMLAAKEHLQHLAHIHETNKDVTMLEVYQKAYKLHTKSPQPVTSMKSIGYLVIEVKAELLKPQQAQAAPAYIPRERPTQKHYDNARRMGLNESDALDHARLESGDSQWIPGVASE